MSSKRAMKQAQKQAYAKHRSNIINNKFGTKKKNFQKSKKNLVFITHYVVISEALDYSPSSGEIVISDKNFNKIGAIEINY